jgi:hypothetical protein
MEKVIVNYATKYYDVIIVYSDTANHLQYQIIDASDKKSALSAMVNSLGVSPILSADKALTKA